jgi:hypothetical protein
VHRKTATLIDLAQLQVFSWLCPEGKEVERKKAIADIQALVEAGKGAVANKAVPKQALAAASGSGGKAAKTAKAGAMSFFR